MKVDLSLDDLLLAYAAGRLPEAPALAVATHLALSPVNREQYRHLVTLGGVLLESIEPEPVAPGRFEALLSRVERDPTNAGKPASLPPADDSLPGPLRPYLPGGLGRLKWRHYGAAAEAALPTDFPAHNASIIRVKAGRAVPRHTHRGMELTVVLQGSFHDATGHYRRGDLALADSSIDHQPTADAGQDCLCFAVRDAPLRLTGPFGRFLNPFLRR